MKRRTLGILLSAWLAAFSALAFAQELPAWLPGCWEGQDGSAAAGAIEVWTAPQAGRMVGLGVTVRGTRATFEFIRIERSEQGIDYVAQPGGKPPVRFAATANTSGRIEFANPQHDFPQRLEYSRDGDLLRAELSTTDRARKVLYLFKRTSCDRMIPATESKQ